MGRTSGAGGAALAVLPVVRWSDTRRRGVAVSRGREHMQLVLTGRQDSDQEELDELTRRLRDRLLELDVDDVQLRRAGDLPEGAKPVDAIAVGALAVTMAPIALRSVVSLVQTWIENRPLRTVSIALGDNSLELEAVSSADQQRLIEAFLAAHEASTAGGGSDDGDDPDEDPDDGPEDPGPAGSSAGTGQGG
ncbi:hypothetical protein GCM10009601_30840 [Streptomyces thermospinosisporus]|uniref:Uncharacterized protein n=2 Tax=Streptomyces thermospinosisporus TaxID=161482 RepID=A0ABN1YXM7_9ACTN